MKKHWQTPSLLTLGTVADITRGKPCAGKDSFCGGHPPVFVPPTDTQQSSDAVVGGGG